MIKIVKIIGRFIGIVLEWVLIFIVLFSFAIRSYKVQTKLAQTATSYLSSELNTTIRIHKLDIAKLNEIYLDGVYAEDLKRDTLASLGSLRVKLNPFALLDNNLKIYELGLEDGVVKLYIEKDKKDFNFQFIADYFASDSKPKSDSPAMVIDVDKLELSNIYFQYDDYNVDPAAFGIDYSHLRLQQLNLIADNLSIVEDVIKGEVKSLGFYEGNAAFTMKSLHAKFQYSNKGIQLDDILLTTLDSEIDIPKFHLLMDHPDGFSYFTDTVVFDAKINRSKISLKDVSIFASALEGMDEVVSLEGAISRRVKDLKIDDLILSFGKQSKVVGNIVLPDFMKEEPLDLDQHIDQIYVTVADLSQIKLPKSAGGGTLDLNNDIIKNVSYADIRNLKFNGTLEAFTVDATRIKTDVGAISLNKGIKITHTAKNSYLIANAPTSDLLMSIDSLNLGKFLANPDLGIMTGNVDFKGELFSNGNFNAQNIHVNIDRIRFKGYNYSNIALKDAQFVNQIFEGDLEVNDENLKLDLQANLNLNKSQRFTVNVDYVQANLNNLHLYDVENAYLSTSFFVDIYGTNINDYSGSVLFNDVTYKQFDKSYTLPSIYIEALQKDTLDELMIRSSLLQADAKGKIDFNTLGDELSRQLYYAFPAYFPYEARKIKKSSISNNLDFDINLKNVNPLLALFMPELSLSPNTMIKGNYKAIDTNLALNVSSGEIKYDRFKIANLKLDSQLNNDDLSTRLSMRYLYLNDSVKIDSVLLKADGFAGVFNSDLSWYDRGSQAADLSWDMGLKEPDNINLVIDPSYFMVSNHKWDIANKSVVSIKPKDIMISDFMLEHETNYLKLDGRLSENVEDKLAIDIKDFQLGDFSNLLGIGFDIRGKVNGKSTLSNPFTQINFNGNIRVDSLFLDKNEVGDLTINGKFDYPRQAVLLDGDIYYKNNQTFLFDGSYFLNREEALDFDLNFDRTDIRFLNSLLDSTTASGIRGVLEGVATIKGSLSEPKLAGNINLYGGNVKVGMFGVNFGMEGPIALDNKSINIKDMVLYDEEGNAGLANVNIKHKNFSDISLDVNLNLEDDAYGGRTSSGSRRKLERFMVMNTTYKEGDVYYGKAFVTGKVAIKGLMDDLNIFVDAKTQRGTVVNLPMFGNSELEESSVVKFADFAYLDTVKTDLESKVEFTGISLDLNFDVNEEATIKVVLDPTTGDELTASGNGRLNMTLNNLGDLAMNGTFHVTNGVYNFSMATVKQDFNIEGGTINFTGDIMNARMDIRAYALVKANVAEILYSADAGKSSSNQEVYCYILLSGGLTEPNIDFDIKVPKASEENLAALNRVKSDQDELNKQFFSLLILNKFQPLGSIKAGNNNAALNMVSSQINAALGQLSKDYRFNVDLDKNTLTGQNTYELGMSKNFLDERLIVSGSFGVENRTSGTTQNTLIGDVNVDYLLNESGTFKVGVFNESNDYSVMQEKSLGRFTQGVSITYQEEFNKFQDFKLAQYFLDFFRKDENVKIIEKRKRRRTPLPEYRGTNRKESDEEETPVSKETPKN